VHRPREERPGASGQILVLFALALIALLAALAVILDGGRVYAERRATQNAADAAAMAGAAKLVKADPAGSLSAVLIAACDAANKNGGFGSGSVDATCGTNGTDVKVHVPGGDGGTTPLTNVLPVFENPGYVQVSVRTSFRSFMAGLLGLSNFQASSLGVAVNIPGNGLGDALLVLDPISCGALTLNGTNLLTVTGGNVQVDSSASRSADAACTNKNAMVKSGAGTGGMTNTNGTNNVVGNGDPDNITPPWTQSAYEPDPLTRVTVPPFDSSFANPAGASGGTANVPSPWSISGAAAGSPGVYWGGITVKNGGTLTLASGTYIMAGGGFNIQGGTVTASGGVTFIYTRDPYCNSTITSGAPAGCNNTAKRNGDIDGGSSSVGQSGGSWGTVASQLQPQVLSPDPYNLSNILIYLDRNVRSATGDPCPSVSLDVGGNGYFNFATGSILYGPCASIKLHGTSDPASHGGAVVSWQVWIDGNKNLDLGGPSVGGQPLAQSNLVQ
jgi:Flp pilus assembly protein TadG